MYRAECYTRHNILEGCSPKQTSLTKKVVQVLETRETRQADLIYTRVDSSAWSVTSIGPKEFVIGQSKHLELHTVILFTLVPPNARARSGLRSSPSCLPPLHDQNQCKVQGRNQSKPMAMCVTCYLGWQASTYRDP